MRTEEERRWYTKENGDERDPPPVGSMSVGVGWQCFAKRGNGWQVMMSEIMAWVGKAL